MAPEINSRVCKKCQAEKPLSEFVIKKSGKVEHCKACYAARHLMYMKTKRRSDPIFAAKIRQNEIRSRSRPGPRLTVMFNALKNGALKRGIPFSLARSDLERLADRQNWKCAQTGILLDLTHGRGQLPFGPTIDRIDSKRGYESGNVQLVCYLYNVAKNRFTDADVMKFALSLVEFHQMNVPIWRAA